VLRYFFTTALQQMLRYKLQSLLVVLGVAIGIANIILLMSMTDMGRRQTLGLLEDFGARVLIIVPYVDLSSGPLSVFSQANASGHLPMEVYTALFEVPELAPREDGGAGRQVSAMLPLSAHVSADAHSWFTVVAGTTEQVQRFGQLEVEAGRWISDADTETAANVAVLGLTARNELFPAGDVLGKTISIRGEEFTVVGTLKHKESNGFEENDNRVFIPLTKAQQLFGLHAVQGILVRYREGLSADEATEAVRTAMASALGPDENIDEVASIFTIKEATRLMDNTLSIFRTVLLGVASIALIVAGIGIMNVMLIRVLRRRTEIGLRRAVGATTRSIVSQFILESAVQALVGALVGLLIGGGGLFGFSLFADWEFYISPRTILIAVGFGAAVGVAFGAYPAWTAARVDPITSLRYEM
jgi:putative ABC transport system permease protein